MTRAALAIGSRVGPYEIIGELGGGGMGMVYRGLHTLLGRDAAIKVLRPELGTFSVALDRFLNEARATTAIRHPGIVEVYDYGHTDSGCAFIAMELLDGVTLGARLAERGTLPVADALVLARRIAAPLAAAHERGVVHRDLKPDNVFLIRDHEGGRMDLVKLLDFGIAKLESATANRTTIGLVLGTPAYMSPEQCRGRQDCDHRSDLYSLGCILFEMLVGQPPYGRCSAGTDLLVAHVSAPVPDVARFAAVPSEVARLVTRLLAKSPDDRPRSAAEVVFEIDRLLTGHGPVTAGRSVRVAVATAFGLAVTLGAVGMWYRWWRAPSAFGAARVVALPTVETKPPPPDAAVVEAIVETVPPPIDAGSVVVVTPPPLPPPAVKRPPEVVLPRGSVEGKGDVHTTVGD